MDTLSHALWGKGLFGYRGNGKIAIFFGAMPDLSSFGLLLIIRIIKNEFYPGPPKIGDIPQWLIFNYDITHSFLTAFICIYIVSRFNKNIAFAMLAWPFHILLDFPFHSKEYFPTKLLYPLTDFSFDGIPWSNPEIWFPNISGIIILFIYRAKFDSRKHSSETLQSNMKFALGKPAAVDNFIIKRRIDILRLHHGFFDSTKSLLDIGCGNGGSLFKMYSHFKSCHGIDIVEKNISALRKSIISKKMKNCKADIHDIDNDTVNDFYYQRAISFEVLEHVKDEKSTLRNIYNSLNHESIFAISVPNKWWIFETHGANLPLLAWNRVPFFSWLPRKIHSQFAKARIYTKTDICSLVEEQGFNILSVDYVTAPMDVIRWKWLKFLLLKTIFRGNTTKCPILSTSIMVICSKI